MTDRENLIELVNNVLRCLPWGEISSHTAEDVADHLIANGVTIATDNNVGDKTNADRIRAMSDEELAHWICKKMMSCSSNVCPGADLCQSGDGLANGLVKWLKQPVETENVDRCVCCGAIIPEGQMVCPNCLVTVKEG